MWQKCDAMRSQSAIEIDMSVTNSTIDAKVVLKEVSCDGIEIDIFLKYIFFIYILVEIKINMNCFRANFPILVQFSKLTACVTCIDNSYDVVVCTDNSKLIYGESKIYKYCCKFVPSPNDVGKEITVSSTTTEYNINV